MPVAMFRIELTWWNGLVEDGSVEPPAEPEYELLDHRTGDPLGPGIFRSYLALEAYIAAHHPGCGRAPLPPAPAEEVKRVQAVLALMDSPPPDFDVRHLRSMFVGQYYQWAHAPETTARLRRVLGLSDPNH